MQPHVRLQTRSSIEMPLVTSTRGRDLHPLIHKSSVQPCKALTDVSCIAAYLHRYLLTVTSRLGMSQPNHDPQDALTDAE